MDYKEEEEKKVEEVYDRLLLENQDIQINVSIIKIIPFQRTKSETEKRETDRQTDGQTEIEREADRDRVTDRDRLTERHADVGRQTKRVVS